MCLVVLGIDAHPDYPLILAANRDEFHARPTQEARWWADKPDILGGRDLQAGGTWLALRRSGRFATVTNFRDAQPPSPEHRSRGFLVTDFLEDDAAPQDYVGSIDEGNYAGFSLLVGDANRAAYLSNREDGDRTLEPGVYGLSNALLDGPWHKVETSKAKLSELIAADNVNETSLMRLMADRDRAPASAVEAGRLDFDTAHAITAPFIVLPDYGTRCTTIVLADKGGNWQFTERRFGPSGEVTGESRLSFDA
ncbi:MAG: NRDE family protein [Proteobacteria bacterium]|nr:NRDE family protein [Pseudomonadota bacterium]